MISLSPLPSPISAVFQLGLDAQPDDDARLHFAIQTAQESTDPGTKAAAIHFVQLHFIRIADLSAITTIEDAQARLDHLVATDPASCENLRNYFRG